jgi:hypothetical protein
VGADHVKQTCINDLTKLLVSGTNKTFTQEKWFKSIFSGNIEVVDVAYQLKATSNKRDPQYTSIISPKGNKLDIFTHSEPFNYSDLEVSNNDK